jgi:hypothetical protein
MSFKISNGTTDALVVDSAGVEVRDGARTRRFRFSEIDCVLLSPDHMVSVQIGSEVFKFPANPNDAEHSNTVNFLVQEARRTTE